MVPRALARVLVSLLSLSAPPSALIAFSTTARVPWARAGLISPSKPAAAPRSSNIRMIYLPTVKRRPSTSWVARDAVLLADFLIHLVEGIPLARFHLLKSAADAFDGLEPVNEFQKLLVSASILDDQFCPAIDGQ